MGAEGCFSNDMPPSGGGGQKEQVTKVYQQFQFTTTVVPVCGYPYDWRSSALYGQRFNALTVFFFPLIAPLNILSLLNLIVALNALTAFVLFDCPSQYTVLLNLIVALNVLTIFVS